MDIANKWSKILIIESFTTLNKFDIYLNNILMFCVYYHQFSGELFIRPALYMFISESSLLNLLKHSLKTCQVKPDLAGTFAVSNRLVNEFCLSCAYVTISLLNLIIKLTRLFRQVGKVLKRGGSIYRYQYWYGDRATTQYRF